MTDNHDREALQAIAELGAPRYLITLLAIKRLENRGVEVVHSRNVPSEVKQLAELGERQGHVHYSMRELVEDAS